MDTSQNKADLGNSRRKLLIKAAKVAPVVTAMAAAPVWATSGSNGSNQSPGMSAATQQVVLFNGFGPSHFRRRSNSRSNSTSTAQCQNTGRNALPDSYYRMYYGGVGGVFPFINLNVKVEDVLSNNKRLRRQKNITSLDRLLLAAYLNADPVYGAVGFPYTQAEVLRFAQDVESGLIRRDKAKRILRNLINEGGAAKDWDADTIC